MTELANNALTSEPYWWTGHCREIAERLNEGITRREGGIDLVPRDVEEIFEAYERFRPAVAREWRLTITDKIETAAPEPANLTLYLDSGERGLSSLDPLWITHRAVDGGRLNIHVDREEFDAVAIGDVVTVRLTLPREAL